MASSRPQELPIEGKTVRALTLLSVKRTLDMFAGSHGDGRVPLDEERCNEFDTWINWSGQTSERLLCPSQRVKIACKVRDEYASVYDKVQGAKSAPQNAPSTNISESKSTTVGAQPTLESRSAVSKLIDSIPDPVDRSMEKTATSDRQLATVGNTNLIAGGSEAKTSAAVSRRLASKWPKPVWHAPWKNYRVISSHLGWVRSIGFEPGNEWFVTGSADRTIKIWDTATGTLKLTLMGHIEQVMGVIVSPRHPYMFSCGLDKKVMCWDLEYNKVIRNYHGHLSGVYALSLHPTLDVLMSGGRDSVCRVWDMRTKLQIHCLSGHDNTVCSILSQPTDPQVITGSHDSSIKLWDLRKSKTFTTLTYHKKSVRAMAKHPLENAFCSASADNIKKFKLPNGEFLHNMLQQQRTIVNALAVNEDGVAASGGDNGSLWFWDWKSGNCFQEESVTVQPGSLESEAGVFAMAFDQTGSRLVTCEADKTIKMWKEDTEATPDTHPVNFRPPKDIKRF